MEITMQALFEGFVKNYHTFNIRPGSNDAKWTSKILGFYDDLGTKLGADVEYEWNRYDLSWFWRDKEDPFLHIEHENKGSWKYLEDTIRKIHESICQDVIAIVYPRTQELWDRFLGVITSKQEEWSDESEVLIIMDACFFQKPFVKLEGHVLCKAKGNTKMSAVKKADEAGFYYALMQ